MSRLLLRLLLIALVTLAPASSVELRGEDAAKKLIRGDGSARDLLPPSACKSCHPQHYEEWRGSMHAYAIHDPVFHAMHQLGQKETKGELGDFCTRCHSPVGVALGEVGPDTKSEVGLSEIAAASVSCEVCHRGVELETAPDGTQRHPENANFTIDPKAPFVGGIPDPVPNNFHASKTNDSLKSPDFCGSCHNVRNQRGIPVEKPHDEYVESKFPGRDVGCIDCHMQAYTGRATPDGPIRHQLRRHNFVGVDVAITPFPRRGFQKREIEAFLRTAAQIDLEAPDRSRAGEPLEFSIAVRNIGAGHNLPTGPSTEREMWLDVHVLREDGSVLFRSGDLDANSDLMNHHSELLPNADPQLALFIDHFEDENGKEVHFMWQAHKLVEGTIPPLSTRVAKYRIEVPEKLVGEKLRVNAKLRFRAFPPHQLRRLGIGHFTKELPIFDMAEISEHTIELVESLKIPGVVRVPEDAESLERAFEMAHDGEEIRVGPGRRVVARTLDFGQRNLVVRSTEGAETTILEASPELPKESAAIFLLTGSQDRSSRIEGFTLRGGRGFIAEDSSAGGAIFGLGASPTIAGNIFVDNRATDGGAIALYASNALVTGNRFEKNRASGAGGAIAILGDDSNAEIEQNTASENFAGIGGAITVVDGVRISGNRLRANRAFFGGALAILVGDVPVEHPTVIREHRILGNSAVSGAVLIRGGAPSESESVLVTRIYRTVIAGNVGGAVRIEGSRRVEIDHGTIVDHRVGALMDLGQHGRASIENSIVWGNRPARIDAEVSWCIVDDEDHVGQTNRNVEPISREPIAEWERCRDDSSFCVPILRAGAETVEPDNPRIYRRYSPGSYAPYDASPGVDQGDPLGQPDLDGTRADLGAIAKIRASHLFVRGDVDEDGQVTLEDARAILSGAAREAGYPCREAADVDGDGRLDPSDAVRIVRLLFGDAPPPPAPFPSCSADTELEKSLGCFSDRCKP